MTLPEFYAAAKAFARARAGEKEAVPPPTAAEWHALWHDGVPTTTH